MLDSAISGLEPARDDREHPRNGLERGLAQLEALGLIRPPHVLLAEYLDALTAEGVLDAATAEQVSAAYNRLRYSALFDDDPRTGEAIASLECVATRLAALSVEQRQQIAARVRERIPALLIEQPAETLFAPATPVPPSRTAHSSRQSRVDTASSEGTDRSAEFSDPHDPLAPGLSSQTRRRSLRPRVPLEMSAVAALATFFGGYFLRESVNKMAEIGDDAPFSSYGPNHLAIRDVWKEPKLWVEGVLARADEDARSKQFTKARLGLELALAYSPGDVAMLNDLAALYLAPDESGATNPQRALQLAEKSLELTRQPTVLDTAAEAHFQCGHIREAIALEDESLTRTFCPDEAQDIAFRKYRRKQLEKFQEAAQLRTAARASVSPSDRANRSDATEAAMGAPPEKRELKPGNSRIPTDPSKAG
jgi:hypothetical protein